jgi:hypothetical protein
LKPLKFGRSTIIQPGNSMFQLYKMMLNVPWGLNASKSNRALRLAILSDPATRLSM